MVQAMYHPKEPPRVHDSVCPIEVGIVEQDHGGKFSQHVSTARHVATVDSENTRLTTDIDGETD
jgi:hypothetical protein